MKRAASGRGSSTPENDRALRDPGEIAAFWEGAPSLGLETFGLEVRGDWWDLLEEHRIALLVSREYEHLLVAASVLRGEPTMSFMRLPHPSGIAVDRSRQRVYVAATRNPNQVYQLAPALPSRPDDAAAAAQELVPVFTSFFPGRLYLHDLAIVDGDLYANAVGQNCVVRLADPAREERIWWPRCVETADGPLVDRNYLQLNSIAAGKSIATSYFSASTDEIGDLRPGDAMFPVDRRGVIFSGATRDVICRGLTRPHSARLDGSRLWVDNSGYGEVGFVEAGSFHSVARLPGWTRGLCFHDGVMFVGTSRLLPRFRRYAPGLQVESSTCGIHALDSRSGEVLASLTWPNGNQIFAVEWMPVAMAAGLPFRIGDGHSSARAISLFYAYQLSRGADERGE